MGNAVQMKEAFAERVAKLVQDGNRAIAVVAFEEDGWDEELLEKHGRIYTLCWFDANEVTYACETRPSYYLRPYTVEGEKDMPEGTPDEERIDQIWLSLTPDCHEGFYVHCSTIDKLEGVRMTLLSSPFPADTTDEEIEESMHTDPPYNDTVRFQLAGREAEQASDLSPAM